MKSALRRVAALLVTIATLVVSLLVAAQPGSREAPPALTGQAPVDPPPPVEPTPGNGQAESPNPELFPAPRRHHPGDDLTAYMIIFSPGDHPFFKFGHNAIWIHDVSGRNPMLRDRVYNYGTFSFEDPALIPKFAQGRFMYWLSAAPIGWTKEAYRRENRGIVAQELALTADQKIDLQNKLEENLKDANKYYKYDYYRDNCSTRVRDMIDSVIGGRIKAAATAPARMTFREHTLRLTASLPAEEVILNLVMGDFIDKPITVWEEAFVPMELQKTLHNVTVPGPDGKERPLVRREFVLVPTNNPDPAAAPPVWWPYSLIAGVVIGGILAFLGRAAGKHRPARIVFGVSLSFFGLLWGFFGIFFLAVWAFTDHLVGYHNENTFLCAPWAIVLVGSGIRVAMSRVSSIRFADQLVRGAAVFSVVGLALKVLPWFDQKNWFFLVFFVPFWLGAAYGMRAFRVYTEAVVAEAVGKPAPKKLVAAKKAVAEAKAAAVKGAVIEDAKSDAESPGPSDVVVDIDRDIRPSSPVEKTVVDDIGNAKTLLAEKLPPPLGSEPATETHPETPISKATPKDGDDEAR